MNRIRTEPDEIRRDADAVVASTELIVEDSENADVEDLDVTAAAIAAHNAAIAYRSAVAVLNDARARADADERGWVAAAAAVDAVDAFGFAKPTGGDPVAAVAAMSPADRAAYVARLCGDGTRNGERRGGSNR